MKLLYRIALRLSLFLIVVMGVWAALFYTAIIDEINDEVDDSLDDYSETIIIRALGGEQLPTEDAGSNNQYFLKEVSEQYALTTPHIRYKDSMVYLVGKQETEPARILSTIFKDNAGQYHELTVSIPAIEKKDLKEAILFWMIFLFAGMLLTIILVNIWVYCRSARPLYVLLKWLDKYKVGASENVALHNPTNITEFQKLNQTVVDSMQRAERTFQKQKQFISNASHEIQTPLAVGLNRIEMLIDDEKLAKEQLAELSKVHDTLTYIVRLNKSLLLLSKIDNGQFQDTGNVNFNELLDKFLPDYEEIYRYMRVCLHKTEKGVFRHEINESLASILLNNLIKNSFVHNVVGGDVFIELSSSSIVFKNKGELSPLDAQIVFERFYQGHKKEGSTGLGLALAKSVCDISSLRLNYYYQNGFHCFEISR